MAASKSFEVTLFYPVNYSQARESVEWNGRGDYVQEGLGEHHCIIHWSRGWSSTGTRPCLGSADAITTPGSLGG